MANKESNYQQVVSLREIARRLGVTHATVSMALRDDPRISLARRAEVRRCAIKMGYRPDPLLQQLSAYRKNRQTVRMESCIAWLNDWANPDEYHRYKEYRHYWTGASAGAELLGYRLEEFRLREIAPDAERLTKILSSRGIRGVLIPPHNGVFRFSKMNWRDFVVVKIGFSIPDLHSHIAGSDQYAGGCTAATRMFETGYRRIAFVSTESLHQNTRGNFMAGFHYTRDRLIPKKDRLAPLLLNIEDVEAARKTFLRWLEASRPEAILFSFSLVAQWVEAAGLKVPQDLALAAISIFDSTVSSGLDQLPQEVGSAAANFLAGLVTQRRFGLPEHSHCLLTEPRWIYGKEFPAKKMNPSKASRSYQSKGRRLPR